MLKKISDILLSSYNPVIIILTSENRNFSNPFSQDSLVVC